MLGASPFGVPVISPDQVNSVRPAARLGRGATSRVATVTSRGRTWYLSASSQNRLAISLTFSGYLSATLSNCVQSSVTSTRRILARCRGEDPRRPHDLGAGDPAVMVDRVVAHHLEILGVVSLWCVGVLRIERVHEADAFDWLLRDAVDLIRCLDAGCLQDRGHDVDHMGELVADAALVLNDCRPRDRHALAYPAPMRRNLLGPGERCVECPRPGHSHVRISLV